MVEKKIVIELETSHTNREDVYDYLLQLIEDESLEYEVVEND